MALQPCVGTHQLCFEIMAGRLQLECMAEQYVDRFRSILAQRLLEIDMHVRAQAHKDLAVRRQPQPIAIAAEIVAER